jgi:hypothetical protein
VLFIKSAASLKQVFEVLVIAEILLDRYVWFILIIPLMFYNKLNFIRLVFKMKKAQYTQKFRDAWMKDPLLKEWLVNVESTVGKIAKCKFCICTLTNKYSDLKNHANSRKHKMNAEIILGKI